MSLIREGHCSGPGSAISFNACSDRLGEERGLNDLKLQIEFRLRDISLSPSIWCSLTDPSVLWYCRKHCQLMRHSAQRAVRHFRMKEREILTKSVLHFQCGFLTYGLTEGSAREGHPICDSGNI